MDTTVGRSGQFPDVNKRWRLPSGVVLARTLSADSTQRYFLYVPRSGAANDAPLLVTVHGVTRGAEEIERRFACLAERYRVVVVAPLFDTGSYPDYQRLGRSGRGKRADRALGRILTEVEQLTAASTRNVYLFGYSGGGQFVHRYAMAYPQRVTAMVIGAAGWYTQPDSEKPYPLGMKSVPVLPNLQFELDAFLRIPATVVVGEWDTERDAALNQSHRIDRDQGATRLERGRRWIRRLKALANARGLATPYIFHTLPRSDHCFTHCVDHGNLHWRVFESLFGPPPNDSAP